MKIDIETVQVCMERIFRQTVEIGCEVEEYIWENPEHFREDAQMIYNAGAVMDIVERIHDYMETIEGFREDVQEWRERTSAREQDTPYDQAHMRPEK